ncbi:MAG: hypothetical protein IJ529_05205 [Alphaproteobacteria bacterium]|nr:hypothetical protein [Alphaproteobacteria bacterium]MBQ8677845.1 hypothetical protein [Alphaproteobacteria bacterium]
MSRSKAELSVTERLIIQLVIYRTKNPKHPTFFGDNKNIAKCIDVQPDTARKAIAKLVKLEYLQLGYDKQGRRHLLYSGKPFTPIIANMNNIDKKLLRNNKEYYEMSFKDAQHELESAKIRIETLERKTSELHSKLLGSDLKASKLGLFLQNLGYSKEQIDKIEQQSFESFEKAEVSQISQSQEIPQDKPITAKISTEMNENNNDAIDVLAEILEKFKIPSTSSVN